MKAIRKSFLEVVPCQLGQKTQLGIQLLFNCVQLFMTLLGVFLVKILELFAFPSAVSFH